MIKASQPGFRPFENHTTALRAWKCIPPLVAGATTFPPQAVGLWMLSNGAMSLQESIERFILSPGWGGKGTRFVREQSDLRIV